MSSRFHKLLSTMLSVSTALSFSVAGLATTAYGAPLTEGQASLSDSRGLVAANHTIAFKVASTTSIQAIRLQYRIAPSNTSTIPLSFVNSSATLPGGSNDEITVNGVANTGWSIATGTAGQLTISKVAGTGSLTAADPISVTVNNLTNNSATASGGGTECDNIANSDTCYILVSTFSDAAATTLIDNTVVSYTVLSPITVTATVDPSLTLTVAGVTTTSAINSNDSNANCSGDDVTATATTIPFGNIRVNSPKCGQQALNVATNAQYGYSVYAKFIGASASANMMQGTNSANNLDPFTATWGTPGALTTPNGTAANVNSGWLGMRTRTPGSQSPGVPGFGTSNFYAGPEVNATATFSNKVMDSSGPDIGTASTYVTLKLITNALQPSDTYTGTMVYAATAKY